MLDARRSSTVRARVRTLRIDDLPRLKFVFVKQSSFFELNPIQPLFDSQSTGERTELYTTSSVVSSSVMLSSADRPSAIGRTGDDHREQKGLTDSSDQKATQAADVPAYSSREGTLSNKQALRNDTTSLSAAEENKQTIDHQQPSIRTYLPLSSTMITPKQPITLAPYWFAQKDRSSASTVPVEHSGAQAETQSAAVQRIEPGSLLSRSQLMPDSLINGKQLTNRIFNQPISTSVTQSSTLITRTPRIADNRSNQDRDKLSAAIDTHARYYQIGSLLTSTTSAILIPPNQIMAQAAPASTDPMLSETSFIILIATLTILILLFCFGLFCFCRRRTRRNLSPSFDGGTYAGLNDHSLEIPIGSSNYEPDRLHFTDLPPSSQPTAGSSINHHPLTNDAILLPQSVALQRAAQERMKLNQKKLKKKRLGCCGCCMNSPRPASPTINGRTRMKRNGS